MRKQSIQDDLQGIVISGDAPHEAMRQISDILARLEPRRAEILHTSIGPLYAGVLGVGLNYQWLAHRKMRFWDALNHQDYMSSVYYDDYAWHEDYISSTYYDDYAWDQL